MSLSKQPNTWLSFMQSTLLSMSLWPICFAVSTVLSKGIIVSFFPFLSLLKKEIYTVRYGFVQKSNFLLKMELCSICWCVTLSGTIMQKCPFWVSPTGLVHASRAWYIGVCYSTFVLVHFGYRKAMFKLDVLFIWNIVRSINNSLRLYMIFLLRKNGRAQ